MRRKTEGQLFQESTLEGGGKLLDFHLSEEVLALARSDKPDDECSGESQPLGSLDDEDELQLCHEQLICHLEIHVQPLPKKGSGRKKRLNHTPTPNHH